MSPKGPSQCLTMCAVRKFFLISNLNPNTAVSACFLLFQSLQRRRRASHQSQGAITFYRLESCCCNLPLFLLDQLLFPRLKNISETLSFSLRSPFSNFKIILVAFLYILSKISHHAILELAGILRPSQSTASLNVEFQTRLY